MIKRVLPSVVGLFSMIALALGTSGAFGSIPAPGPTTSPLVKNVVTFCNSGLPVVPDPTHPVLSRVTFSRSNGTVTATVVLMGATPNTTWGVALTQIPSGTDCNNYTGSVTTNANGFGTATVSRPAHSGDTGAFVDLFYGNFSDFYNSWGVTF